MAKLYNGKFSASGGFKVGGQAPIDDRTVVATKADLLDYTTFQGVAFLGLTVTVSGDGTLWALKSTGVEKCNTSYEALTDSDWAQIGAGASSATLEGYSNTGSYGVKVGSTDEDAAASNTRLSVTSSDTIATAIGKVETAAREILGTDSDASDINSIMGTRKYIEESLTWNIPE